MRVVGLWIAVGVLGGFGGLARVLLDGAISGRLGGTFPSGILFVNVSGSLLLGLLSGAGIHGDALLLAGTAALGSFTTFSTWMFESQRLAAARHGWAFAVNVFGSVLLGVGAAVLGRALGGAI